MNPLQSRPLPWLIQGGMGVGVSGWELANTVARTGQLGVVSGTGLDSLFVRRLQDGDPGGHVRSVIGEFPVQEIADHIFTKYFKAEGRKGQPYRLLPMQSHHSPESRNDVTVLGTFVEVALAKLGHNNAVGINLLTKIQFPTLATLYGAMLAGVDYVLMGAGIPRTIPGVLDDFAAGRTTSLRIDVTGLGEEHLVTSLDPNRYLHSEHAAVSRPAFLPIVSSVALATMLSRKSTGDVAGFIIEGPTAGGHNAPPRGAPVFDAEGQPVYGERDVVDLEAFAKLGYPFWLAGGMCTPEKVSDAVAHGATGVQVGTLFAYCRESGISPDIRHAVEAQVHTNTVHVRTDPRASSTGFPFKVVQLPGTMSEASVYKERQRICNLGYLREAYVNPKGKIAYRCSAEPVDEFLLHGGTIEQTVDRKCLCNGLFATIQMAQIEKNGVQELPIVTSGDDVMAILPLLEQYGSDYSATAVVAYLSPIQHVDPIPKNREICV